METAEGPQSPALSSLFDAPDKCEGCGIPERSTFIGHDGNEHVRRGFIAWMPLLEAYTCRNCLEAYSRWVTYPVTDDDDGGNMRVPMCVVNIEKRNKAESLEVKGA